MKGKFSILYIAVVFLLVANLSFVSAQAGISGVITNQGLQFLGLPSSLQTLIQTTICISTSGISCFESIIKGQVTGQLLNSVAQASPEMGEIIGVYNQLQPLIESGKIDVEQDIEVNNQGETESGIFSIESGEIADVSKFVSKDLEDGSIKISGLTLSKREGVTTFNFDKADGFLKIGDNSFENIAADSSGKSFIKINEEGNIINADFLTNENGGVYNFNGLNINAPANSRVVFDPLQALGGNSVVKVSVVNGGKLSEVPVSLTEGSKDIGSVEYLSENGNSFLLNDGTNIQGRIKFSNDIPEGFISPKETVIFNEKISVSAGNEPIILTSSVDPSYKTNSFYPIYDDYYAGFATDNGKYDIKYFDGNGNIAVSLENSGVFLDLSTKEVSTWVFDNGKTDLTIGNNAYYYSKESFVGKPFKAMGELELNEDYKLIGYKIEKDSYVPGETKTIKGTQKINVNSDVEGVKVSAEERNLIQRVIDDPIEAVSHPIRTIKGNPKVIEDEIVKASTTSEEVSSIRVIKPGDLVSGSSSVTSNYGYRKDPFTGKNKFHDGIDVAAPSGSNIKPFQSGKVTDSGYSSSLGNYVKIDNGNGLFTTYGHMNSAPLVKKGDSVSTSSIIGKVGSTGKATGNHLHFSAEKNGKSINPEDLFK